MFCFQCEEASKGYGCTAKVLVENFDIRPIGVVEQDVEAMMDGA